MSKHPCTRGPDKTPCGRFTGSADWGPENCRLCYLYATDHAYRVAWGGEPLPPEKGPGLLRRAANLAGAVVRHVGDGLRNVPAEEYEHRLAACRACPNHDHRGNRCRHPQCGCTLSGDVLAKARWRSERCPDNRWRPAVPEAGRVRHLLYHVYPAAGNDCWRWHVAQLLRRIDLFNGRRVVAVVTDASTDRADDVKRAFGGAVSDYVVLPNRPELREVLTHEPLYRAVESTDPTHATLWAHAKGVTRPANSPVRRWAEVLYETCLDHWPHVERLLRTYPLAGSFLKVGHGWAAHESTSDWHYSGSWVWSRNRDVFLLPNWPRINRFWSGIEPWPSLHFARQDAGCIFHQGTVPELDLYSDHHWRHVVEPAYARWKLEREADHAAR